MSNLPFGILTIAICSVGYFISWKYWTKDNYKMALLLLVVCGFALRLYTSFDFFLHSWDERYHALVAKNLIEHPLIPTLYNNPILGYDYRGWAGNHIWVHKQPLPLWTMAGSMRLFGVNEIALRLPSILLTSLGIWLSFFIGRFLFNKRIAYLSAFFYSINGLIIELTAGRVATDHIDIFFLFFVQLAIFFGILFIQKQKTVFTILAGISLGAAILSKWLPALIVIPVWLLLLWNSGKFNLKQTITQGFILLLCCTIIFLPWQIYVFKAFPLEAGWEASFNLKHFTEVLEGRTGPFYYFIDIIRINYGELIYLPIAWFTWKSIKNVNDKKRWAILIWFLIPLLFFSAAKTKMQAYLLFTAPALFLMTADFYFAISHFMINRKRKWIFRLALILLIALPARYTIERIKPFSKHERKPAWVVELKNLKKSNVNGGVLFNYDKPIEAMFYTDLAVYSSLPGFDVLINLVNEGNTIYINDHGNIPENIRTLEGISIIKLKPTEVY